MSPYEVYANEFENQKMEISRFLSAFGRTCETYFVWVLVGFV